MDDSYKYIADDSTSESTLPAVSICVYVKLQQNH